MSTATRHLALLALLICACAVPPVAQAAPDQRHEDNVATAVVSDDGGRAFDFAFEVLTPRGGDVLDNFNAANAGARCTGCRATAIAFQIVLVSGVPGKFEPHNRAVAVNDSCTECVVAAEARQFVRVVDEPVKFTDEGRAILADVRAQLRALEGQDLSVAQIHDAVETQEARVRTVLADDVVAKDDGSEQPDVLARRLLQDSDGN